MEGNMETTTGALNMRTIIYLSRVGLEGGMEFKKSDILSDCLMRVLHVSLQYRVMLVKYS